MLSSIQGRTCFHNMTSSRIDKAACESLAGCVAEIEKHTDAELVIADLNCPNCGAPLKVNVSGVCGFCGGKITSGEFDWVLSRIEQDESYVG